MAKKNKKRGKSYVCIRLAALTLPPWCYLPLSCFLGPVSFDVGLYLVAGQASFFFYCGGGGEVSVVLGIEKK